MRAADRALFRISAHSYLFTPGMQGMTPDEPLHGRVSEQGDFGYATDADDVHWFTLHGCLDFFGNGVASAYTVTDSRVIGRYEPAMHACARWRGPRSAAARAWPGSGPAATVGA